MAKSENNCRMLVFVRPVGKKPTRGLENRMKDFLKTGDGTERLDDKLFANLHSGGQIADYLLWNRKFIAEMKSVNGHPANRISRLINDELKKEPRAFVIGSVGIQHILSNRENGDEINRMMINIGGRPIRKLLQRAEPQIADTRAKLQLSEAAGLAIILIDSPQKIEAGIAAYAAREALKAGTPRLDQIDFVWLSIEAHAVRMPDGRLGYPEIGIWRAGRRPEDDRAMMGQMFEAWAMFNEAEIIHLDHTAGWETLTPIGDGWPLRLQAH